MNNRFRWGEASILAITSFVLCASFYLQYIEALVPCPLCLMQRGMMVLIFVCVLVGFLVMKPFQRCLVAIIQLFFAMAGAFFALRQLWLQSLPPLDTGMCLPGIEKLIYKLPWHEVLHAFVWGGKSSCGEIEWAFMGLSMPSWSLIYFSLIGIVSVFLGVKCFRNERV